MAAEQVVAQPRFRIKIDPRSFETVPGAIPKQFRLRGKVSYHGELTCEFWAFRGSPYEDLTPWFISLVAPKNATKDWPSRQWHEEIVREIKQLVEVFWEANKPGLKLVEATQTICLRPSHCRKFVTLSAAAISAGIAIQTIRRTKNRTSPSA